MENGELDKKALNYTKIPSGVEQRFKEELEISLGYKGKPFSTKVHDLIAFFFPFNFFFFSNLGLFWVGRDFRDHPIPTSP